MSPSIGIWASSKSAHLSSFESIATITVGAGGSSDVQFLSIPQTYKHLQLRVSCLPSTTQGKLNFNGDTTDANYYGHALYGTGAAAGAISNASPLVLLGGMSNSQPIAMIIDILDYTNTNKYKTARVLLGQDLNGSGQVTLLSILWKNAAAITQLDLTTATWNTGTFALYGIKA